MARDGEGTVIGTHVKLAGILSDPNDVVILGKLEGEIHSDHTVTVGPEAQVKGPINAARLIVAGTIKGNVHVRDRLELQPRSNVSGNIETRDLVIHSGATFNGRCQILGGDVHTKNEEDGTAPTPAETPAAPKEAPKRPWPGIRLANLNRHKPEESAPPPASDAQSTKQDEQKQGYEVE